MILRKSKEKLSYTITRLRKNYPFVKRPFKTIVLLHIFKYIFRKQRSFLVRPCCDFCLEGYPSSGNSFLFNLLMEINPQLKIAHHTHSAANIKSALLCKVPVIAIIRHPLEAISSANVRFSLGIRNAILEYIDIHSFILRKSKNILLVDFNQLINNPKKIIVAISGYTKVDLVIDEDVDTLVNKAKQRLTKFIRENKPKNDVRFLSLPEEERARQKEKIYKMVVSDPKYKVALSIYEKLKPFLV